MKGICLIVWMLVTLVFVCSIVGIVLLCSVITHFDAGAPSVKRSAWMEMGLKLLDAVINKP